VFKNPWQFCFASSRQRKRMARQSVRHHVTKNAVDVRGSVCLSVCATFAAAVCRRREAFVIGRSEVRRSHCDVTQTGHVRKLRVSNRWLFNDCFSCVGYITRHMLWIWLWAMNRYGSGRRLPWCVSNCCHEVHLQWGQCSCLCFLKRYHCASLPRPGTWLRHFCYVNASLTLWDHI
jgi:hypothetical protein